MAILAAKDNARYQVKHEYAGVSSDTKPTLDQSLAGSTFYETDTAQWYVWNGASWRISKVNTSISFDDSASVETFGRLRTSSPVNVFDNKNIHDKRDALWEEPIVGAIIVHGVVTAGPFVVGETITGGTSGATGVITIVDGPGLSLSYTTNHNDFSISETITGGTSGASAVISSINTGSHVYHTRNSAMVTLQAGKVSGDSAVRQTHRYFSYVPGKGQEIWLTFLFGASVTNITRRAGYYNTHNGIYLEQTSSGVSWNIKSNVTGSPVTTPVLQSAWNLDKMDGTGPSGITLDFSKKQFLVIDFAWQGDGPVRCGFFVNGKIIYTHKFAFSNSVTSVYMSTPSLPVKYEIINTGGTAVVNTMSEICSAVVSNGGENPSGLGFSVSNDVTGRTVTTAAETPILAVRLKNTHPRGGENRVTAELSNVSIFCTSSGSNALHYEVRHVHDPTGITGATWADVGMGSAMEYSANITGVVGHPSHKIEEGYLASGQGGKGGFENVISSDKLDQHRFLSQNYNSTASEMFVIYAQAIGGTVTAYAHFSWVEFD